jgi:putative sigma-54 modulation protein
MNITIRSQDFRVGERVEEYAKRKLERLHRYLPGIGDIRLDLGRQRTSRGEVMTTAQITLRHERGAILRAEEKLRGEEHATIEATINMAVDKMYRQIERFKGKHHNHKGKTRFSATVEELDAAEDIPLEEYTDTAEFEVIAQEYAAMPEVEPEIVRRKQVEVTPMTEAEAIEQMELLGHPFFMFFNAGTGGINVLYKRSNGDYGVLVPEMDKVN